MRIGVKVIIALFFCAALAAAAESMTRLRRLRRILFTDPCLMRPAGGIVWC